jgi:hypothetical protein
VKCVIVLLGDSSDEPFVPVAHACGLQIATKISPRMFAFAKCRQRPQVLWAGAKHRRGNWRKKDEKASGTEDLITAVLTVDCDYQLLL